MRLIKTKLALAVLTGVITSAAFDAAKADPYKWCAIYSGGRGGASNCYFVTLQQCQATVSGIGGFCTPNQFYDGRPEGSGPPVARQKRPT